MIEQQAPRQRGVFFMGRVCQMSTDQIDFLKCETFAVAGASNNRQKYGNIVFRALVEYVQEEPDRTVYPLNPNLPQVESVAVFKSIGDVPKKVDALSIVTPPPITRQIVTEAIEAGVKQIWMQPGAEDEEAIRAAEQAGLVVIAGGPCILVAMKTIARK